jgi:hypothetical protein
MEMNDGDVVNIFISVDEVRQIRQWMHVSLDRTEMNAEGHFLLECEGTKRTWVTTDRAQMTIFTTDGSPPSGLDDHDQPFEVLVNSRLFRGIDAEDLFLEITQVGDHRRQALRGDGYELQLPGHPGDFPEWRKALEMVTGTVVEISADVFRQACASASVVPWGEEDPGDVLAWIFGKDGRLVFQAQWETLPDTVMVVETQTPLPDSVPVLVNMGRLRHLLSAIVEPTVTLTLPSTVSTPIGLESGDYRAVLMPVDRWSGERRRLQELLCEFLGVDSVTTDDDGDYPIEVNESAQMYVRLKTDARPISAQVFSVLASNVPLSRELLEELNTLNASLAYAKLIWAEGAVMAEMDIVVEDLDMSELSNALTVVRNTTLQYQDVLSAFFGAVEEGEPHG